MEKKKREPKYFQSPINSRVLNYRVYYMTPAENIMYSALTFFVGGFVGLIFYGGLFTDNGEETTATVISNAVVFFLVGIIATLVLRKSILEMLKRRRDNQLRQQFKDFLESLASSLSSGNTLTDALENAYGDLQNQYTEDDYIVIEIGEILSGVRNGHTVEEMLEQFGTRANNEDIENFGNVISNCYRMGGDFSVAVSSTRDVISDKMSVEDEIETAVSSNKLQLNAMCLMPIVLVAMLKKSSSIFAENLATPVGVVATTIAIAVIVGAYFWGRKIIDVR